MTRFFLKLFSIFVTLTYVQSFVVSQSKIVLDKNLRRALRVNSEPANVNGLRIGDRVKVVAEGVVMKHLPKFKEGFCASGLEGEIKNLILKSKEGIEVSVNRPVLVAFDEPKFSAHFEFEELEGAK